MNSYTTVVIPFDESVIFINLPNRAKFSGRHSEIAQTLRHDLRESNLGQCLKVRQAVASWHGPNQGVPRGVTTALEAIYAVSALVYCQYQRISFREPRSSLRFESSATRYIMGVERMVWLVQTAQF